MNVISWMLKSNHCYQRDG